MALHVFNANIFKLDGGAMFGVVPKSMWNKINPADENNMTTWVARCLLFKQENRLFLVETGLGNKQDAKFKSHFYVNENEDIAEEISKLGYKAEEVTDVIFTHLHFDHNGGAIKKNLNGDFELTFPNANYWTSRAQWELFQNPNQREKASFLKENMQLIVDLHKLHFIDEEASFPNIEFIIVSGHTESQTLPLITYNDHKILFAGDLFPSHAHIRMPYVMAYDMKPLLTMEEKEWVLEQAVNENWFIVFGHDPQYLGATIKKENDKYLTDKLFTTYNFN